MKINNRTCFVNTQFPFYVLLEKKDVKNTIIKKIYISIKINTKTGQQKKNKKKEVYIAHIQQSSYHNKHTQNKK